MKQYYYSVSVLPAVTLEGIPFFTPHEFLEHCAVFVSADDLAYISSASLFAHWNADDGAWYALPDSGNLSRWFSFLEDLQTYLAFVRAQSLGRERIGFPDPSGLDARLEDSVRKIASEENPHRAELAFLQLQWEYLDNLELGHFFDREKLAVYFLRLQIALRRNLISDRDAGNEEFTRQYDTIAQAMMEIV